MVKLRRLLLKLSGESLAGNKSSFGLDGATVAALAGEVAAVAAQGIELGLVIGGGNIFRGVASYAQETDRVTADHMGMLATVINSLAFQDALERLGASTRVMTAIEMRSVAEPYIRRRALRHLEKGRIVIFAGGTSNPYFSTDTAAALRALEIKAQLVAKATKVDGVYDRDPMKHPGAQRYETISLDNALAQGLAVMDGTALAMCRDNKLPILVFDSTVPGNIMRMAMGEPIGTLVHP